MLNINVEQNEQIRLASIECSIKFRLSHYSSFKAWNGLEALFNLISELLSSAAIQREPRIAIKEKLIKMMVSLKFLRLAKNGGIELTSNTSKPTPQNCDFRKDDALEIHPIHIFGIPIGDTMLRLENPQRLNPNDQQHSSKQVKKEKLLQQWIKIKYSQSSTNPKFRISRRDMITHKRKERSRTC